MRGDSVRDFYAKTLALLGLGMLAGTGALVDYWPTGVEIPNAVQPPVMLGMPTPIRFSNASVGAVEAARFEVAHTTQRATAAVALAATPSSFEDRGSERTAPDSAPTLPTRGARTSAPAPSTHAQLSTVAFTPDFQPSSIPAGEVFTLRHVEDPIPVKLLASAAAESSEPTADGVLSRVSSVDLSRGSSEDDEDGLLKKTGASILHGGAKTGASIRDAFRVVSGAVRRALPN